MGEGREEEAESDNAMGKEGRGGVKGSSRCLREDELGRRSLLRNFRVEWALAFFEKETERGGGWTEYCNMLARRIIAWISLVK